MRLKCAFACAVALSAAVSGSAADWYVDNAGGSEEYDGLSATWDGVHGPKARIQSAVELAEDGSTVWVAPGVYGDDQGVVEASSSHHACRVLVTKPITLKSIGGRDVTHIVGRLADDSATLCGEGAVAGIVLENVDGGFNASVIEGFTIRDCATTSTGKPTAGLGTGVAVTGKRVPSDFSSGPWVVDCVVSNCAAGYGSIAYVNAARTKIAGNRINKSGNGNGSATAFANLVYCVITGNADGVNVFGGSYLVNCTQVNNAGNAMSTTSTTYIFNSIVVANGSDNTRKSVLKGCVSAAGYTTDQKGNGSADGGNAMKAGVAHVAAPLLDDFRPVVACDVAPGAKACGLADASLLDVVPEAYRLTDYLGNAVTPDGGKIHAGAVQTPMTPVAGVQVAATLSVDGQPAFAAHAVLLDVWPRILRLGSRLDTAKLLFFFEVPDTAGGYRFPDADGTALFVPFPGAAGYGAASAVAATHELFVDAAATAAGDGTSAKPFATIQEAVDAVPDSVANYAVIRVAPGVYDEGATAADGEATSNRVMFVGNASYRVIATEGPAKTVIKGASDPADPVNGIGPAAVRCVRANRSSFPVSVEGFTLTGGRTAASEGAGSMTRGGALLANSKNAWLVGCVVSNNVAGGGSAMAGGTAYRTAFGDNPWIGDGMFVAETTLADCFVRHVSGHGQKPLIAANAVSLVHDTLVAAGADVPKILPSDHGYAFNCVVANAERNSAYNGKKAFRGNVFRDFAYNGNLKDGTAVNVAGVDYVTRDPGFADEANGNCRLFGAAAAFGLGTAWDGLDDTSRWTTGEAYTNYYRYVMRDMDGSDPYFVNGKPTPGAWQRPANGVKVTAAGAPSVALEGAAEGFNAAEGVSTVSIRPVKGARPAFGVAVNGVTNRFARITDGFMLSADDLAALGGSAEIVVLEGSEWHVDAVNGDDGNGGFFADDAFKTLAQAMSGVISGDTVYAHPGTYGEGSMIHSARLATSLDTPITLRSRVVVPAGVTLCAVAGADETAIVGARDPDSEDGLGEGAMRCVTIATNACLRGFTVTGGFTRKAAADGDIDNAFGGGILSLESSDKVAAGEIAGALTPTCWIEDCVITNNAAVSGGGAFYGSYRRCRFFGNAAVGANGGAVRNPFAFYGCLSDGNRAATEAAVCAPYRAVDCTFGASDTKLDGKTALPSLYCDPVAADYRLTNCLFVGGAHCRVRYAAHCAIPSEDFIYSMRGSVEHVGLLVGDTSVDARYAPLPGTVACDAVTDAYELGILGATDVWGGQRVYNGVRDVGAVEYDWRGLYAAAIRGVRVSAASPVVVKTADGAVRLPDGAELVWARKRDRDCASLMTVRVADEGTLAVTVGDETIAEIGAGEHAVEIPASVGTADVRCAYSGAGFAEILRIRSSFGFFMLLR